ncbi:MAG: hypothetical protein VYE73_10260, partial [Acidobacteriota bacterium]|nr:hypothetical protein [Acidobacteriota bacterium]
MSQSTRPSIEHPSLVPAEGVEPEAFAGTDQGRLAIVLEAAATVSLLASCGCATPSGFAGAVIGRDGHIGGVSFVPSVWPSDCRNVLSDLLETLFGGERVPGRGEARRGARELLEEWRGWPCPLAAETAVARILEVAPFLWKPRFGPARARLVGVIQTEVGPRWWVAGPPWLRLLARERGGSWVQSELAGDSARDLVPRAL